MSKPPNPSTCLPFPPGRCKGSALLMGKKIIAPFPLESRRGMSRLITFLLYKVVESFHRVSQSKTAAKAPFLSHQQHSLLGPGLFLLPCLLSAPLQPSREAEQGACGGGRGGAGSRWWRGAMSLSLHRCERSCT